jgi:predicted nucleic acid-binding protein
MSRPIEIAVDTNILLDLADDNEAVIDALDTVRERIDGAQIIVLPTVIQELNAITEEGETKRERELAFTALRNVLEWGFQPVNCVPVGHGITEETARRLRANGLIPEEEVNDSLIVAEAALLGVSILLSGDTHIKDIEQNELKLLLDACDLRCPLIASPHRIVRDFFRRRD